MEIVERVAKNLSALGAFLMSTPEAARFIEAQSAQDHQARLALARDAETLQQAQRAEHERHTTEIAPLAAAVGRAEVALATARDAVRRCTSEYGAVRVDLDNRINRCHSALRASAPPALADFAREMQNEVIQAQAHYQQRTVTTISGSGVTWSNQASIDARQRAAIAAMHGVHDLVFESLTAEDLDTRLAAIRASLPAVDPTPEEPPSSARS